MPRRNSSVPAYLLHKPTGQAYARIPKPGGGRKIVYLGKHGSPASRANYERLLLELRVGAEAADQRGHSGRTLNEVMLSFARHADEYYRDPDGKPTSESRIFRSLIRQLRELYGHKPVTEFGPLALIAVQAKMVESGTSRRVVNQQIGRIKTMFKWLASRELIPVSVYQSLTTVSGLRKGKTTAAEPPPVGPVSDDDIAATLPFLPRHVAGMVELQRLTGMRPGEVCRIAVGLIDKQNAVWVYRPGKHKTDWRGKTRNIAIGPKGQAVLARFVPSDPGGYYFSPRVGIEEWRAERSAARKTPRWASHMARNAAKRKAAPKRKPADRYSPMAYAKAVGKAVAKANAEAARHDVPKGHHGPNLRRVPHWHPNQIRHTHGTEVRRRYGLEAAQVTLGHSRADVTQIYAERDGTLAEKIASEIG